MSNFRKAAPRRTHKERAQPASRRHLGLLEKHSDYTQRARAYHSRQQQLDRLRLAARLRNPDEFYHRMERSGERTLDGRHVLGRAAGEGGGVGGGGRRSVAVYKAMKEQDRNYLVMELQKEKHAIERMSETLQGLTDAPVSTGRIGREDAKEADEDDDDDDDDEEKDSDAEDRAVSARTTKRHVIFTSQTSQSASSPTSSSPSSFDPAAYFSTLPALLPLTHNRPTLPQLSTAPLPTTSLTSAALRQAERQRVATYREVLQREGRVGVVEGELGRVDRQRLMMTKGRRRKRVVRDKFGDVVEKKSVFVWKQERKK